MLLAHESPILWVEISKAYLFRFTKSASIFTKLLLDVFFPNRGCPAFRILQVIRTWLHSRSGASRHEWYNGGRVVACDPLQFIPAIWYLVRVYFHEDIAIFSPISNIMCVLSCPGSRHPSRPCAPTFVLFETVVRKNRAIGSQHIVLRVGTVQREKFPGKILITLS